MAVRYMEEVVIPFQTSEGMTIPASFTNEEDPDGYIRIRRFHNAAQRVERTPSSTPATTGTT
ncbi:hypothetical protein [Embleya sp. NPDC059237]|uniref:hypothetical protein n=1 Tax=Embleya sp. NPDC059237 TaxID=3346784 RepID=UPI00369AFE24